MKMTPITLVFGAMFITSAGLAAEDFSKVDANGDGLITMDEAAAGMPELTAGEFHAADANGDGALSLEEFAAVVAG